MKEMIDTLIHRTVHFLVIALASLGLAACAGGGLGLGAGEEMSGGEGNGANYTPYDIYSAVVYDATGIVRLGGTGSVRAWVHGHGKPDDGSLYGGGGMCCTSYPTHWVKDRKFIVKWIRYGNPWWEKKIGWRTAYVATVTVPPYGRRAGALYVQFLPGDKVRFFVTDIEAVNQRVEKEPGWNYLAQPAEDDPYIYQGVVDPEPTAWLQAQDEATEKAAAREAARQAAIPPEEKKRRQEEADHQAKLWRIAKEAMEPVRQCVQREFSKGLSEREANRLCAKEISQCRETLSQPEFRPDYADLKCGSPDE